MKILGIRYCSVSRDAEALATFFRQLGMPAAGGAAGEGPFTGVVYPAGESWIEIWPASEGFDGVTMLQIVVDDADEMAAFARSNGVSVEGPTDAHGERIYQVTAPGGLQVSFQSPRPR